MQDTNIIAIEIGSSAIKGAHGYYSPEGVLTVQAVEEEPLLDGVRYGAVSNLEEVATLVTRIIRKIENRVSPRKVSAVHVALGGRSFCSMPREVERRFVEDTEVTDALLRALTDELSAMPLPDREILLTAPRGVIIDKTTVARPKGTMGRSVRMLGSIIVGRPQARRNIQRLFADKLHLPIAGYQVRQMAIADAVLTTDERRLGCMLVDFGADTTAVSVYKDGYLQYMATIPMGSRNITRDIMRLNYLEEQAEELKISVGSVMPSPSADIPSINGVDYTAVNNYVSHRANEIILNIKAQIEYAGYEPSDLLAGIVIVGRGCRLTGFNDRLREQTHLKVRVGSVVLPNVVFGDGRISPVDSADVIAVLAAVAAAKAGECLSNPQPIVVEPDPVVEPEPQPQPVIEEIPQPQLEPAKKKRKSWSQRIKDSISDFMSEAEDDELRDD